MELLCNVAAARHRRAGEEVERGLVVRCSEEGPAPRVVAQDLTCVSADLQAPVRPDLVEDGPVQLNALASEGG